VLVITTLQLKDAICRYVALQSKAERDERQGYGRKARDRRMERTRDARAAGDPASVGRLWVSTARQANRMLVYFRHRRHELHLEEIRQTCEVRS
jgi:hypothetical protein